MLVSNNKVLKINNKWLKAQVLYYITLVQPTGGTITASTLVATPGTLITLSNVSDTGYTFDSYTINGEPIVGNTFILGDEDVIVSANYIHNILSVNVIQSTGGTVTATPVTGYYGTTITLSQVTEDPNYTFDYYTVDGSSISGNTFILGEDSVDVKGKYTGNFNPLNLPQYTIRLKFVDGVTPQFNTGTGTQVSSSPNVWDLTTNNSNWMSLLDTAYMPDNETDLLEVLGANSSGVTNMVQMFHGCKALTNVALFDTSSLNNIPIAPGMPTGMRSMFVDCSSLTSIPWFDTHNVADMGYMFQRCTSLSSVPRLDTSNVTNMQLMFFACKSLTTVPLFNTSNVTDMSGMFSGSYNLTTVPLFDTHNVTNMSTMFESQNTQLASLTSLPLFDTSNVTDMGGFARAQTQLTSIPLFNTSKVTNMNDMFYLCYHVQSGALALYQQASSQTTPPSSHSNTFAGCGSSTTTGAAELAQIPSDWGGTGA